jgi:hypothetical protein
VDVRRVKEYFPFVIVGIRKGWLIRIQENGVFAKGKVIKVFLMDYLNLVK